MSRFGSLDINGIQRLAADREDITQCELEYYDILGLIFELTVRKHPKSKLTPLELRTLFQKVDERLSTRSNSFASIKKSVSATRLRPKGEKQEAIYFSVFHDENRCYRVSTLHLAGTSKHLHFNMTALPFSFSEHALQRVMERCPTVHEALTLIASSLINWSVYLVPLMQIAKKRSGGHLGIPTNGLEGLLLGECVPQTTGTRSVGRRWDNQGIHEVQPNRNLTNSDLFVIKTFVNDKRLRADQRHSMEIMHSFQQEHSDLSDQVRNVLFWPEAVLLNEDLPTDHEQQALTLLRTFRGLSDDPELLNAFQQRC